MELGRGRCCDERGAGDGRGEAGDGECGDEEEPCFGFECEDGVKGTERREGRMAQASTSGCDISARSTLYFSIKYWA